MIYCLTYGTAISHAEYTGGSVFGNTVVFSDDERLPIRTHTCCMHEKKRPVLASMHGRLLKAHIPKQSVAEVVYEHHNTIDLILVGVIPSSKLLQKRERSSMSHNLTLDHV